MSSSLRSSKTPNSDATSPQFDDATTRRAERELLQRLRKTQSEIRRVDLWTTFCALATIALGLLFLGVLFDHWILPDGFSDRGRLYFEIFWLVSSVAFLVARLAPVLKRRVNSLYAAKVLEEVGQDKHNSTINWLQLRKSLAKTNSNAQTNEEARLALLKEVALQAVGKNRATSNETLVDCSPLVRWGVVFAVLVALCALYAILSPKSPFASFARIVAPFAKIERPQALRFESVTPGDATVFQGDVLEIIAEIPGAKANEVEILFSTEDSRLVDVPLAMDAEGVSKFRATLPGNDKGFEENLLYRVVVGRGGRFESVSETFRVEVRPQPSFRVEKATFSFPSYTGLEPQTFENQGDVRALEGTQIEIVARSNYPLESAYFLPDGVETRAVKMTRSSDSPELATTNFALEWKETNSDDEKVPAFSFYRLLSQSVDGEKNRDAQNYNVSIVADLPPTINWNDGQEEIAEIPLNDGLRVKFQAEDPDYSLRRVELNLAFHADDDAQVASRAKLEPIAIPFSASKTGSNAKYETGPTPFVGVQSLSCTITPEELGLEVGDEIEYWGVAADSKEPNPNVASTEKRLFVVVESVDEPQNLNDEKEEEEKQDEPQNSDQNQSGDGSGEGDGNGNSPSQDQNDSSENGQNDSKSGNQNSDKEKESDQGDSGSEQGEAEGEEGAESNDSGASDESEQNGSNGQGEESGEQGADNSQEEGASGGSSSSSSNSRRSNERSNESGNGDQGQSDNSNGGEESQGENESGSSDSSTGADNSPSSPISDKSSDGSGGATSSNDEPIDPETNPGDAFEKILDFAQKTDGISPNSDDAQTSKSQGAQGDDDKKSDSSEDSNSDGNDGTEEEKKEDSKGNGANSDSQNEPSDKEKRDLPNRESKEKPSEDSPRYQANNPEKVDPNVKRRQGDVDPKTNDFLAQNADPNAEQDDSPRDPNQNIALDPNDNSESVAADSVDPKANEAKGNSNAFNSNAPFELDDRSKTQDDESNADGDQTDALEFPNPPSSGGGSGSNSDSEPQAQTTPNPTDGFGGSENRDPNKEGKEGDSQGAGASDQNAERQGGGGGSGLGELEPGEQTLAPADAPRLQYAEKATNFVLNYLEDELKGDIDPRLLKELGWSEEQLREFLERWKKMREDAKKGDKEAKERYLESLESVGLEDGALGSDARSVWEAKKKERNARNGANEAARLKTPERLDERVRAFTRGVAKSTP